MLTVTAINSAKPKEKPYKLSDEKSMYLLIEPSGGKLWRFDYRFSGKRKTLALGVYPDVTLAQAREKRDNARKLLAGDPSVDPNENRKKVKAIERLNATNTFESIAREWWASHR